MMQEVPSDKRELVLFPFSFAYIQDASKGVIRMHTGPMTITPTGQDVPIRYDSKAGRFLRVKTFEECVDRYPVAVEGYYIALRNPSMNLKQPIAGTTEQTPELNIGRKVNIPGPATFALWPGQAAEVIKGHTLRSNQYLIAKVYNEEEAKQNISQTISKPVEGTDKKTGLKAGVPESYAVGYQFIIRGDELSFYIPPTGISIVRDKESSQYIREALTLERLEYCVLVDEDGNKRYEKGPQVVFPNPSENFKEGKDGDCTVKKFRAVELNENQGIQIKVIAGYTENGKTFIEGEELFITGKETSIYYPREEHSIVRYDGRTKHFASAIPSGEGRYVMNRNTGDIKMTKGPAMLLADPRIDVLVRRVLSEKQIKLWYPGNQEALIFNASLRADLRASTDPSSPLLGGPPTAATRGAVQNKMMEKGLSRTLGGAYVSDSGLESMGVAMAGGAAVNYVGGEENFSHQNQLGNSGRVMASGSRVNKDQDSMGDSFDRSAGPPPRQIVLDTKYDGVPTIDIWPGYAIQITSKSKDRRVIKGPDTVLLEYDESLDIMTLSTGKPKNSDRLLETTYLKVENNVVSDIIWVDTLDHVRMQVSLSYTVNFEGDSKRWFMISNYVKFLCDHVRSILKSKIKKLTVEEFYKNSTDHIREIILGKPVGEANKRPGMTFIENGMRILDVDVLEATLTDASIKSLLDGAQLDTVRTNVDLSNLVRQLDATQKREGIKQQILQIMTETAVAQYQAQIKQASEAAAVDLAQLDHEEQRLISRLDNAKHEVAITEVEFQTDLSRAEARQKQEDFFQNTQQARELEYMRQESEALVARFSSAMPGFSEALATLSRDEVITKVAQAMNIQNILGGKDITESFGIIFRGTGLEGVIKKVMEHVPVPATKLGNGANPAA